ncbi:FAD binding domain protein [Paraburkholderia xenovorans LB400]|uniref:Redutase n=1 Tax=Paraburkholderia xenovorans (strain LB400) TaxID=266265 RepID=Q143U1_PARXL|nr:FAD-dependent oxidoreductase [Paraburkholderia xenovorans]ABE29398.1 Putative redutase [Paraburkholderia xenovorans LB400]AIP32847.1 FAD binding domain protein [Paraburkholderia xenovorans LB400]
MSDLSSHILVLGAGHAGDSVAAFLRQYGWQGSITLAGNEGTAPYHRPPLSKALLLGQIPDDDLSLRPASFYDKQNIRLLTDIHAIQIERAQRRVKVRNGEPLAYDHLILATGARVRALDVPGKELEGVMSLRGRADSLAFRDAIRPRKHVVIVGGGYIGLEAAASASKLGANVTVIEREARLLARVASPFLAQYVHDYYRARDVAIELSASVAGFEGNGGRVTEVRLADDRTLLCDVALVGIGVLAEQSLAVAAGLACNDGVLVDEHARTSDERIHAIGDCTRRPLRLGGSDLMVRLESVHNATEQARQAASDLCGRAAPVVECPWTWSDQFDLRLQLAGFPKAAADTVVRGDPMKDAFAIFHLDAAARLQAVEAINAPTEFAFARRVAASGVPLPRNRLSDPAVPLKALMDDALTRA